jgi:phage terminase large subunit GpA-like protein
MAIGEHHKTWMLERGQWRQTVQNYKGKTAGFHLSSLYSPLGWRSWRDIAAAWESATSKESGSVAAIKTFKNTELGETWLEQGEAPQWERLLERSENYTMGTVPDGGLLLTAGVDVQRDRIEVSVWAFGRGKESWLVEHRVLAGDTGKGDVWSLLAAMLSEHWIHASGAEMPLLRIALDTGYATQEAYGFVRAQKDNRLVAIKGVQKGAALVSAPRAIDVSLGGKRLRAGIKLVSVVSGIAKTELYSNLNKTIVVDDNGVISFPSGYVHLPAVDAEYVQQLCAEQLVTKKDRHGYQQREWQKMRDRNEALDCFVYARAAAAIAGLDRFEDRHWKQLEYQLDGRRKPKPEVVVTIQATQTGGFFVGGRRVIRSNWMERRT